MIYQKEELFGEISNFSKFHKISFGILLKLIAFSNIMLFGLFFRKEDFTL